LYSAKIAPSVYSPVKQRNSRTDHYRINLQNQFIEFGEYTGSQLGVRIVSDLLMCRNHLRRFVHRLRHAINGVMPAASTDVRASVRQDGTRVPRHARFRTQDGEPRWAANGEPTRRIASAPHSSLYGHGEAPGSQLVRRRRQAIHQPEHDIELRSI
jgi:hypothetical protein